VQVDVAWAQIQGKRKSQQDSAAVMSWPNGFRLLLLADGMGGIHGGDIASALVIEEFKQHFCGSSEPDMRNRLIDALEAANIAVFEHVRQRPELDGMGTTLIAVAFDGLSIQWISVGDSPMWLVRNGRILRLNENHSMAAVLEERVAKGEITQEEAMTSPERSQLLEAVLGENIEMLDAPDKAMEMREGDTLLLASDGVETLTDAYIQEFVAMPGLDAELLTHKMLDAVESAGRPKQDNATLIALRLSVDAQNPTSVLPEQEEPVTEPPTAPPRNSDIGENNEN
jgi:serine/threonine protein phosphatase PrpC